jgi:hypothetical protein
MRSRLYRATRQRRARRRRPKPGERATLDWRYGRARAVVFEFCNAHGRMPTKRECNAVRGLPSYTTLKREFGRNPLTQLDRMRDG